MLGESGCSRSFPILAGVRQGCVLSPRLFCSALEWAMSRWRARVATAGVDLGDGMPNLIDLRFADDILLFASSSVEAATLLDTLVEELAAVG